MPQASNKSRPKDAVGVEVIEKKTGNVVDFIDCHGRGAEYIDRVRRGVEINMNHADYETRLVLPKAKKSKKSKKK